MSAKKPPPVLEVRFDSRSLRPELVSLVTLSSVLSAIHQLASGRSRDETEGIEETKEIGPFQLLDVRRGSVAYQFAGQSPEGPLARLRSFGHILERHEDIGENDFFLGPLEDLSAIARRIDCAVILKEPGHAGEIIAKIEPSSYKLIAKSIFMSGDTSIAGEVKAVGGATDMRCRLRVPFQQNLLYCKVVDSEIARKIGNSLYKHVVIYGTATWLKDSWKIVAMTIINVIEPKQGKLTEAIKAIREAGGKEWDKIGDVESYLEEVSGI